MPRIYTRRDISERFWEKVDCSKGTSECWQWLAFCHANGYGQFQLERGRPINAHRMAYQLTFGPIPKGLQIDHLCRNRGCVNPSHLDAVTQRENIMRGESPMAKFARRDSCMHGHLYDDENTYYRPDGHGRMCRQCKRDLRARARGDKALGRDTVSS